MRKSTVNKLFVGSMLAVVTGALLAVAAIWVAITNDVFILNGPDITGIRGSALAWSLLGGAAAGGLVLLAGTIGGFASWIGALLNTWQLANRTWFVALLLMGIFSLGFLAMIAYVLAGPDSTRGPGVRSANIAPQATPA